MEICFWLCKVSKYKRIQWACFFANSLCRTVSWLLSFLIAHIEIIFSSPNISTNGWKLPLGLWLLCALWSSFFVLVSLKKFDSNLWLQIQLPWKQCHNSIFQLHLWIFLQCALEDFQKLHIQELKAQVHHVLIILDQLGVVSIYLPSAIAISKIALIFRCALSAYSLKRRLSPTAPNTGGLWSAATEITPSSWGWGMNA